MRYTQMVWFLRLIGAGGAGAYLGAAIGGLLGLITGQVFTDGSTWLTAAPVLLVFGAVVNTGVAWLSRRWLFPVAQPARVRRYGWFAGAGLIMLPLVGAVGYTQPVEAVVLPFVAVGFATTAGLWLRSIKRGQVAARQTPRRAQQPAR